MATKKINYQHLMPEVPILVLATLDAIIETDPTITVHQHGYQQLILLHEIKSYTQPIALRYCDTHITLGIDGSHIRFCYLDLDYVVKVLGYVTLVTREFDDWAESDESMPVDE